MRLTNYWWLLIWLVAVGGFLAVVVPKRPVKVLEKIEYRWSWVAVLILICPYIIWAGTRSHFGDTESYRNWFLSVSSIGEEIGFAFSGNAKDPGFSILLAFIKCVIGNNDVLFFLMIAAFQMLCIAYFFRKYSDGFLLCMFMFVLSTDYLSWMFNGMRQFIAVCIVLLTFGSIVRKKYLSAIIVILLASTIHASALIMLPIIFIIQGQAWNRKTILMLIGTGIAIFFVDSFTSILDTVLADTQYNDIITNDIWKNDDGTNIMRALFYSIPAILSLFGKKTVERENSEIVNVCVNCSICTMTIYFFSVFSSGIYIGRLPIFTTLQGYAVVPWLINHMFAKTSAKIVTWCLIGGFLAFFYAQMHAWGIF